jgi:y4mF family transcriptional regulator
VDERVTKLAAQVRERRRVLKLTQDQLADLAGCSARFVRSLEAGKPGVRLDKLLDVATVLGLELELHPRGRRG